MTSPGRYVVPNDEDYEPGSNNQVLKNYLSIKSKTDIEAIEELRLERTELELIKIFSKNHRFTVEDICNIHELWLGDVYPSAGQYRSVSMSKANFLFAAPARIEASMHDLKKRYLSKYTPCHYSGLAEIAEAVGIVHIELILIYPFREGNGRTARLLADLMVMQAGKYSLNYNSIDRDDNIKGFEEYILAIHAGVGGDYEPIKRIFSRLLEESYLVL